MSKKKTYEELGGRPMLEKMCKVFYDKVYEHPWLNQFFNSVKQEIIELQQVDFLQGGLGGKKVYCGKLPVPAHKHMYITSELYQLRSKLLLESLIEVDASKELTDRLIKLDLSFAHALIKKSTSECEKRYNSDEFLIIPEPNMKKAA
ncbi:MAG: group 1 truncated hemoglobin [Bacteriovoracaceae bacterium]|jgi:hemoglobin|nr:group 1 truncated hemoglobin [Bacteriovoracaceae bacterium]